MEGAQETLQQKKGKLDTVLSEKIEKLEEDYREKKMELRAKLYSRIDELWEKHAQAQANQREIYEN